MKTHIISIGNSKGIRIPKALLKLCHIKSEVNLDVKGNAIIIEPIKKKARDNWEEAFQKMHNNNDDNIIIDDSIDLDTENWQW